MTKLKFSALNLLRSAGLFLCLLLIGITVTLPVKSQPVLGAQNTALGGGGTAYLTGFEATFWNPANLAINDRRGTVHIGVGQTGILYEPVLSTDIAGDQFFNFTDSFYPYKPSATDITSSQRETILSKNYPRSRLLSQHQTRADIILGGLSWQRGDATFAIAARARFSSRIEVGRGWYSHEFFSSGNQQIREFTLNQQINRLYELSFGYGREFTFISGLLPRLSKLYVGFAPKIVLAGPSFDANYRAQYFRSGDSAPTLYSTSFSYRTSGEYSRMTADYQSTSDAQGAINSNLNRKIALENTGYGLGFDFGLTYLVPLGDELSILEDDLAKSIVSNSLRFSFSINDMGVVRYNQNPLVLSSPRDTLQIAEEPPKESMFIGAGGQYLTYFDTASEIPNPVLSAEKQKKGTYSTLLPTSMNAGVMLDLTRIKVMGDLTLGLNNTAFTSTKLAIHLGLEVRPVEFIPIRVGTRLAAGTPTHFGVGTGIETKYWDFTVGTQVIVRSRTFTSEFVGSAFAGIQLHL